MDVRCEKCLTVYEFDDAQVGPQGVTVKCTQCGNLFKVKRKDEKDLPAVPTPGPQTRERIPTPMQQPTKQGVGDQLPHAAPQWQPAPLPAPRERIPTPVPPVEPNQFLIRLALSGEIFKIYDLSMIKDWIMERKITREDQISKDGEVWKPLGGVPELQPLFRQAEQGRSDVILPPAPAITGEGPSMMGGDSEEHHATTPKPKLTPAQLTIPPPVDQLPLPDDEEYMPPRRSSAPMVVLTLFIILGGGIGYLALFQRQLVRGWLGQSSRAQKAYEAGREKMLVDDDDGLRQATVRFAEAHGADADDPLPLAGLAEANATWAWYLREDAKAIEATGPQAAATLKKEAQGHLDDGKKAAQDALGLAPDSPEVNRAMAEVLLVEGAQSTEVDGYVKRALQKKPTDPETLYVGGALSFREGKLDDARTQLELARGADKAPLRASFLLAKLDQQTNKLDEARSILAGILQTNPNHERAKALLNQLNLPPAATVAHDAGAAAAAPDMAAAKPVAVAGPATPTPIGPATPRPDEPPRPGDYNKLVQQGDKLSENGKTDAARKSYEKALTLNPQGVEAITGIAYCDLDKEKFLGAIDKFKQALSISPEYGDALVGLAEAYKVQGNKPQAIDYYKRYLKAQPNGPKASMAKQNLRDLQPRESGATPAEKPGEEPKNEGTSLPRPPPEETPPPPP
jgi:predicted Zn finger-like uncharacterized protein